MVARICLLAGLVATSALTLPAQIPIPPYDRTLSWHTYGFWFQTPVPIVITGLRAPDELMHGMQAVEVIDLMGAPPPTWPATGAFPQRFYAANVPSSQMIPTSIAFNAGDFIGILGAAGDATIMRTSAASRGTSTFAGNVLGNPVTLTGLITTTNLAATGGNQPISQYSATDIGRVEVYVQGHASAPPYGTGCGGDGPASFYEWFGLTMPNDLSGTGITLNWNGQSYVVTQGANPIVTPFGAPTPFLDDQTRQIPLPWAYPTQASPTNSIWVCSNGWVGLEPTTITNPSIQDVSDLLEGPMRFCPYWTDLNPDPSAGIPGGGSITLEQDPGNAALYHVTWTAVPQSGLHSPNTFQLTLHQSGSAEFKWGFMAARVGLVGYSTGNRAADPGNTDISAITTLPLGTARRDLSLSSVARPVLGTTAVTQTNGIPMGSPAGFIINGFRQLNPGINLGGLGAPGCFQHQSSDFSALFVPSGATYRHNWTHNHSFPVPNNMALAGATLNVQSAVLAPGANALGVITSNGIHWVADIY